MTVIKGSSLEFRQLAGRCSADPLEAFATESSLRIVDLDHGPSRTAHRHPHSEEVVVVISGRGRVWVDGHTTQVEEGDVVVIPRGAPHATIPAGGGVRLACFFPHPELASNLEETEMAVERADGP